MLQTSVSVKPKLASLCNFPNLAQDFRVPEDHNSIFSTSKSDIQAAWVVQKTDPLMFVASNAAKNDVVLLSPLECIYASNFDFLVEVLLKGSIELHIIDDVGALPLVRGDNSDLRWDDTRFEELGNNLFNVRRLSPAGYKSLCCFNIKFKLHAC